MNVTDRGVAALGKVASLRLLHLSSTSVSDASLPSRAKIANLAVLQASNASITPNGALELPRLKPNCKIFIRGEKVDFTIVH